MGNPQQPGFVPAFDTQFAGQEVTDCFTNTLHAINHGVIKLSRLSVAIDIYRGFSGMRLPDSFLTPNIDGVCGGCEFGFMSTTASRDVALNYAHGQEHNENVPRTLFTARMKMTSRGAYLGWLSQYPEEVEFLYAPL
jgi:hypothetical protein